ncbi:MAG: nucleoside hydrolase, partial [Planctomycetota bacterium]|nr:nucleoside hydrolase [Planctomycetota bacterium]
IALGPLTNIARAFSRDPEIVSMVGQIHIMGGSLACGNVTPAAEFNMYCDPEAARTVLRSPTTKTLIPLDVTRQIVMTYDQLDELPDETTATGRLLRSILPHAFRAYRMHLGLEGIHLNDAVALVAALHPELFQTETMAGDVETSGELTTGATIFDRRPMPEWRDNMDVATEVDVAGVVDAIIRGLSSTR